jgi:DNA recombination protein RmuC
MDSNPAIVIALIVLALLAACAGAGVVWLLIQRGALAARLAAAEQARSLAEAAALAAQRDLERLRAEAAEMGQRLSASAGDAARLTESVRQMEQRQAESARLAREQLEEAVLAEQRRFEAEREGLQREARARDEAAQRREADLKRFVDEAQAKLREAFGAAAGEQLKAASQQFLTLAEQKLAGTLKQGEAAIAQQRDKVEGLVKPIGDTLARTDEKLAAMERDRAAANAALAKQIEQMQQQGAALQKETGQLVQALREPRVRGYYGEVQLKRVAELAGMREYCDFVEQDQTTDAEGKRLRPDMVIRLPNQREIVVDAKANLLPFLDALKAETPEATEAAMVRFADGIAAQATSLGKKAYWQHYTGSPEFVVMFVPGDQFVDAALARRPDLLETAAAAGVILASPSTLIAMLRAVAVAFREERLTQQAAELLALGKELHDRAAVAMEHVEKLGSKLQQAVGHYNAFVGSYETRLEPTLERFAQLGATAGKTLPEVEPVTVTVRELRAGNRSEP